MVRAIAANDPKAIDAAFTGTGDDRKLLDATVASLTALRGMDDALVAKFGEKAVPATRRDAVANAVRQIGLLPVTVDADHPDAASIWPAGGFPFEGYTLASRDGQWTVTSLTIFPQDVPAMLAAHGKLTPAIAGLTKRVKAGEFATATAADAAFLAEIGPSGKAYADATRKGPPPGETSDPITGRHVTTRPVAPGR